MKLYIIGNGFDRAHGLKTSYWDFRCYLEKYAEEFLFGFEKLYGYYPYDPDDYHISGHKKKAAFKRYADNLYDTLWRSFELSLGHPAEDEFDTICNSVIDEMDGLESGPIGIENTLNEYFEEQFGFVTELQNYLLKWAKQIRLNKAIIKKDEIVGSKELFLTFNYTPTLERVYGVPQSNICHIHGGIPPYCNKTPIVGHGNKEMIQKWEKWKQKNNDLFDEGGSSYCSAISKFYRRTLKDTDKCLTLNYEFFRNISGIDGVTIIGHSLGDVDLPYFKKVVELSGNNIPWIVVYHTESEKDDMNETVKRLGIKSIFMVQSNKYWDR